MSLLILVFKDCFYDWLFRWAVSEHLENVSVKTISIACSLFCFIGIFSILKGRFFISYKKFFSGK